MTRAVAALHFICLWGISLSANAIDLNYIRQSYDQAVFDKKLCQELITTLKSEKQNNLYLAYLGGLQTIWANHAINPISKWSTFKEGKKNIEKAIQNDPENIEIRYIRLSVQKNAPSFLGYHHKIIQDETFLKNRILYIDSILLFKQISNLLNSKTK